MDLKVETFDKEFMKIVPQNAQLERVASGFIFTEAPVWCGDHLLFPDIPKDRIVRWRMLREGPEVTTYRHPCGHSNGLTLDRAGRLIACEPGMRRVTRTELDGSYSILVERYNGKRFSGPSDVITGADGTIYFTDNLAGLSDNPVRPAYAFHSKELSFQGVYRIAPDGKVTLLADDFQTPNGIVLSPDEKVLYVIDTPRKHVRAFDITSDGTLRNGRVFIELKKDGDTSGYHPDGLKVDEQGNIYVGGPGGFWVVNPEGYALGCIMTPNKPTNLCFGDADWKTLYMTAEDSIFRLRLNVPGLRVGPVVVGLS